jgi:hypothetical protein
VIQSAGCVTVAHLADPAKLHRAFGADTDPLPAADFPVEIDDEWAWFTSSGEASVVVEDNGVQGSRGTVLGLASRASSNGKAASVFWNVNGLVIFSCARKGKLVGSIELLDVDEDELEDIPRSLHRLAMQANLEGSDPIAVAAAMVEKFTGVSFGPTILDHGAGYAITPDYVGAVRRRSRRVGRCHPRHRP